MTNIAAYAQDVLDRNDEGRWTFPDNKDNNQHYWSSVFSSIAYSRTDPQRGAQEILSLLQGQWQDGMIPHVVFEQDTKASGAHIWRSKVSEHAPLDIATSGITHPPLLAEAVYQVAQNLPNEELTPFLDKVVGALHSYHSWLYNSRDQQSTGLITTYSALESHIDNFPRSESAASPLGDILSQDTHKKIARLFRKQNYRWDSIAQITEFAVKSVTFNALLVRNNELLVELTEMAHKSLPSDISKKIDSTREAFEKLWDENFDEYFHYDELTDQSIPHTTIASIIALYSGAVPKQHIADIVKKLHESNNFQTKFPIPTNPTNRQYFDHAAAWHGATHLGANWLIYDGLKRVGLRHEAALIRDSSMQLFELAGARECYSSMTGEGLGAEDFSESAALYLIFASENNHI